MARRDWKAINWQDSKSKAAEGAPVHRVADRHADLNGRRAKGVTATTPERIAAIPERVHAARLGAALTSAVVANGTRSATDLGESVPRLSLTRVLVVLVIIAGLVIGGGYGLRNAIVDRSGGSVGPTWFAPYVDVTLTPTYQFQVPADEPARQIALGFIVAQGATSCVPSWGDYDTLDQAAQSLDLDGRIAQLRSEGVGTLISFGGSDHTDLAVACRNKTQLASAYTRVIERYRATMIDLDVEGTALSDVASIERRADALSTVQDGVRSRKGKLGIWLTLPVERTGLDASGLFVVSAMLRAHVALAGINIMAMDFGPPVAQMGAAAEQAAFAVHAQLARLYPRYGIKLSSVQIWHTLGVTVMIGQNDDAGEQFTLADASSLGRFAGAEGLGRLSTWSLNRDAQCGSDFGVIGELSTVCSGVAQTSLQFDSVFSDLEGRAAAVAGIVVPAVAPGSQPSSAGSPYPIWQAADPYVAGYKVTWQGNIYQSQWYNQGDDPAAVVQDTGAQPWLLIGPVLPGQHAPTVTTLPAGTYPSWSPTRTYPAGTKVLFDGLPYEARFYNAGDSPAAEPSDPTGSPWDPLYQVPGEPASGSSG
jgi:chitinase